MLKNTNLFTFLTKSLLVILPFYVIIKVYSEKILGIKFLWFFIKEFIIILLFFVLIYEYFFNKNNKAIKVKLTTIDYAIFIFILYWIIITFVNNYWFSNIFYWGRYDFLSFIVFLIYKHWKIFLKDNIINFIKIFLISATISIFLWLVIKFILWEEFLTLFGFTFDITSFWFWWWIPIYQWVEASWIRRFQWILDSPLSMGYFLLMFIWLFVYMNKKDIDFWVLLGVILLFFLIFITYSRWAILWFIVAILILLLFSFKSIFRDNKKILGISLFIIIIVGLLFSYIFQDKVRNIFIREGSTTGHINRIITGFERFSKKPLGSWLWTSGPAYRSIFPEKVSLEWDRYYIPESWFIQILVEGGIVYFSLFMFIILNILNNLYKHNRYIFIMFMSILTMNLFLHVFEATYITIILFLFLSIFYTNEKLQK